MKIKSILLQIMWIILQLPQCIVGAVMLPFLGKLRLIRYENYCWIIEGEKMSGGISLGCFIFLSKYNSQKETVIRHELGHVIDSHRFMWLYLLIIGLPSILWAWLGDNNKCYYSFFTEKRANKNSNLGVNDRCQLYIKD